MNYMLNFNVCEISPLLLENAALRMGNLQVIKISSCCEWLPLTVSLGNLIRNGMGNLVNVFYSLRIYLWDFLNMMLNYFDEILRWGLRAKVVKIFELNSAAKYYEMLWRINCYLFHLRFLRNVAFCLSCEYSDYLFKKFICWENGVLHVSQVMFAKRGIWALDCIVPK